MFTDPPSHVGMPIVFVYEVLTLIKLAWPDTLQFSYIDVKSNVKFPFRFVNVTVFDVSLIEATPTEVPYILYLAPIANMSDGVNASVTV